MSIRRVFVVTGTRAEYGLLRPVLRGIDARDDLELTVIVTGSHLLGDAPTSTEVLNEWPDAVVIRMQDRTDGGRVDDAAALGRGIAGIAELVGRDAPEFVVVLGDRIEAFAAASAAAIAGVRVAHIHGGDRAEGVADDSMRHAITKLAHVHFPASDGSADRIRRLGELESTIHQVGSPALDELDSMGPMPDASYEALGSPRVLVLFHPIGRAASVEASDVTAVLDVCASCGVTVAGLPNHDPGCDGVVRALESSSVRVIPHLSRGDFIGLLRRVDVIVGNSSAGLIETSALGTWCVNVGSRQSGRDQPRHVVDVPDEPEGSRDERLRAALAACLSGEAAPVDAAVYGAGDAGVRIASFLATLDFDQHPIRKRILY